MLREVTLRCLPTNIPEKIEADVSELQMGDTLTVADLVLPSDTEIVSEPDEVVASIVAPRVEEEPEEAAEEGEGAEVEETAVPAAEEETAERKSNTCHEPDSCPGNPVRYLLTRHNVGFRAVDKLIPSIKSRYTKRDAILFGGRVI